MIFDNVDSRKKCISDFKSRKGQFVEPLYGLMSDDPDDVGIIGETDTNAKIQSHAAECDIHVMVQRFLDGDPDAFNTREGFYGDVSNVPVDCHSRKRMYDESLAFYNSLPEVVREKYSIDEFYSQYGSDSFNKFMDSLNPNVEDASSESEVVDNAE